MLNTKENICGGGEKKDYWKIRDVIRNTKKPINYLLREIWQRMRTEVINIQGEKCLKCGSVEVVNIDHIKPKSKYPKLAWDIDNLQVLCRRCNLRKSAHNETDYRR